MSDESPVRNKTWYQKLRWLNKFGREAIKERQRCGKYRERRGGCATRRRAHGKTHSKKTGEVRSASLSASVLLGWITRWSFIWPRTFLLFTSVSFRQHPGVGCANSHLQIQNAVRHSRSVLQGWSACRGEMGRCRMTISKLELHTLVYTLRQISTRQPSRSAIDKRNQDNLFAWRANMDTIRQRGREGGGSTWHPTAFIL